MCIHMFNVLYYTILYYTIPYHTIPYYTILYYTILYYTIMGPGRVSRGPRSPPRASRQWPVPPYMI